MALAELREEACRAAAQAGCPAVTVVGTAPGRVEVLGNHTDYNDGFILAAAIDRHIVFAGAPAAGDAATVHSTAFAEQHSFSTAAPQRDASRPWCDYVMGVVDELRRAGHAVGGFAAAIAGDVPLGAGLSSSAALEVAAARFLTTAFGIELSTREMALLCQRAENNFVGMNCGILDQWSSLHGAAESLIHLDCRSLETRSLPLGAGVELVIANTRACHELVDGTYNRLREACFAAAAFFAARKPGVTHLRDVSVADLERWGGDLPPAVRGQAEHVIRENDRVERGVAALEAGDLETLGRLMKESHASSRDTFGNSCAELDTMVGLASELPGCYGCRLSGGGFGGATINLVAAQQAEAFAAELARRYEGKTGITPEMHITQAVAGARAETVSA